MSAVAPLRIYRVPAAPGKDQVLEAFAKALGFPPYFGMNFDALADALSDFSAALTGPATVIWEVSPEFEDTQDYHIIQEILQEVTDASRKKSPKAPLRVFIHRFPLR